MKYTRFFTIPILAAAVLCGTAMAGPGDAPGIKQLGITPVTATKSTRASCAKQDQEELLNRFTESMSEQLIDAFHNTRKFAVIARSDLKHMLDEQNIPQGGIIDPTDSHAAAPGKIKGVDFLLVTTVDDFVNTSTGTYIESMGTVVGKRSARVSLVLKVYDSTGGKLLQSVSLPIQKELAGSERVTKGDTTGTPKAKDDSIVVALAAEAAQRTAMRVVDVVFPAKIISIAADVITVSRGEGAGIAKDEVWEVFALGNELKDPDTGEVLGREEAKVGEIVITDVLPKFSKARVLGENRGVDVGSIVRVKAAPPPPADK